MTQVIIFFGWLMIGIAGTLVIFGHASIAFVYGVDHLMEGLFPPEGLSSLIYASVAFVPGAVVLGIGKLMQKYDQRETAQTEGKTEDEDA